MFALLLTLQYACNPDSDPACECSIPWMDSPQLVYGVGEIVKHKDQCWISRSMIQADSEEPGAINSSIWELCEESDVLPCDCPNEWSMMLAYPAGAIVFFQDACYIARIGNENDLPANNPTVWVRCE